MVGKISELTPENDPQDVDELEFRDDSEAADTDAQNKAMSVKILKGLNSWKQPVRIATEVNDTLSGLAVRDGATPVAGDRVLVKAQTTASANGIYEAAAGAWTRSNDFDTDTKAIANILVPIEEGTVNADKVFQLTTNNPITIGTTSLTFVEFGAGGTDIGCKARRTTTQSIANNTQTAVSYTTEDYDTDTMHDNATNPSRITIRTAGKYLICAGVRFADSSAGALGCTFRLNGVINNYTEIFAKDGTGRGPAMITIIDDFAVDDFIELFVIQTSGGALDIQANQSMIMAQKIDAGG